VFDKGDPPRTDSLNITVNVVDANDNDPEFERQNYEAKIVENSPPFSPVISVRATDADKGVNGHVTYGFTAQTHALHGHLFGINATTGVIYLKVFCLSYNLHLNVLCVSYNLYLKVFSLSYNLYLKACTFCHDAPRRMT